MEVRTQRPSEENYLRIGAGYRKRAFPNSPEEERLRKYMERTVNGDRKWQEFLKIKSRYPLLKEKWYEILSEDMAGTLNSPEQIIFSIFRDKLGHPEGLKTLEDGENYRKFMEENYTPDLIKIFIEPKYEKYLGIIHPIILSDQLTRLRRDITSPGPHLLKKMEDSIKNELKGENTYIRPTNKAYFIFDGLGLIEHREDSCGNLKIRINPDPVYGLFKSEFRRRELDYPADFLGELTEPPQ